MKKIPLPLLLALVVAIVTLPVLFAWITTPPPSPTGPGPRVGTDVVKANIRGNLDQITCSIGTAGSSIEQRWEFPGEKANKVYVDAGTLDHIFDYGSPRTAEAHDQLILPAEPPSELKLTRKGSALLLCDKQRLGVIIVRQYCINNDPSSPWNNEIEEIAFPKYGEIWLTDELYAGLANPASYAPPAELLQELRAKYSSFTIQDTWRARRFSEVLPAATDVNTDCRKDFDGIEKLE